MATVLMAALIVVVNGSTNSGDSDSTSGIDSCSASNLSSGSGSQYL